MNKYRKQSLIVLLIVMAIAPVAIFLNDTLKPTREELELFYSTEFEKDTIVYVVEKKYPMRGNYSLFQVGSGLNYYPILMASSNSFDYDIFLVGGIISKKKKSCDIELTVDRKKYELKLRHPKDEDGRLGFFLIIEAFLGFFLILVIFLPNTVFEFLEEMKNYKQNS